MGRPIAMLSKDRVHAALEGNAVDRYPVTALYSYLTYMDRFEELTGEPFWKLAEWQSGSPSQFISLYKTMAQRLPFEIIQPISAPSRETRENTEFVFRDGRPFRHNKKTGAWHAIRRGISSGHAVDYSANETQVVFDRNDVNKHVHLIRAEEMLKEGVNDYLDAAISAFGKSEFILSGGLTGVVWDCQYYLGQTNVYAMMVDNPALLDYLSRKILEQNIEIIRRIAAAGGDAIYIDDATTTSDMISVEHYERFSLPFMKAMVQEIHRLGHKAIVIYFGGIADRLEQIASIGADGLLMEASMKGYVNDVARVVRAIGSQTTLFANIDPIGIIQNATDEILKQEIRHQAAVGLKGRGFVISPASPLTPGTPLQRISRFIELARQIGAEICADRP